MIFRSFFLDVVGNDTPNNIGSLTLPTAPSVKPLILNLKVNGTSVGSNLVFVDTVNPNFTTPITTTVGALTVVVSPMLDDNNKTSGFKVEVDTLQLWETAKLSVEAIREGRYTYSNTFDLFGYDLGNNPLESITGNPDTNIIMMYDWSAEPSQVDNAFSRFTAYRKPYTQKVYGYSLISQPSQTTYYNTADSSQVYGTTNNVIYCNSDTNSVTFKSELLDLGVVVATATSSKTVAEKVGQTVPKYQITSQAPECNCGCSCQEYCTYNGASNSLDVVFDTTPFVEYQINDVTKYPYFEVPIKVLEQVYNSDGVLVDSNVAEFLTPNGYVASTTSLPVNSPSTYSGDLFVKVTVSVEGLFTCTYNIVYKGCGTFTVTKSGCNKFLIKNITANSIDYSIAQIVGQELPNLPITTGTILPASSVEVTLPNDGLYYFVSNDNIKYIPSFCNLDACLSKFVASIMCSQKASCSCGGNCGKSCTKLSTTTYEFNAVMSLAYMYLSVLNTNCFLNRTFLASEIDAFKLAYPIELSQLYTSIDVLNKTKEYCGCDCGCGGNQANLNSSPKSGCGCGK